MNTCEYAGASLGEPRSHPWVDAAGNPECQYYDLTEFPELIHSALEDFRPWNHYGAVERFYNILSSLNKPGSSLESNDCEFTGPQPNVNQMISKSLQCSGRLMILFRNLVQNTVDGNIEWLTQELHQFLAVHDKLFRWGVVGTTIVPVHFLALEPRKQLGKQLMISFWAWGNSEVETMKNLERLMKNLFLALKHLSIIAS